MSSNKKNPIINTILQTNILKYDVLVKVMPNTETNKPNI